ncbi:glycosyltransferase [Echinicola vietnamensis]|uniref:Glycosyl transferase n=1 Tax=Echinicola vietnamensis (strain DSM 17526 / LMG 23754 / KMM 6221) TaxID=926556 RepID=L0G268_ECHVK|nr:glycosyltransferase [Echinicola vietnamensis]AGA79061.1 glycosyl transferase [Echinicola vietnamensis DSM 17526]
MDVPLVSVIVICHNHGDYVFEALNSVLSQEYPSLEMIIVDNGSQDGSIDKIKTWLWMNDKERSVKSFLYEHPINYCEAFNEALETAQGDYVIDLSGDDVLIPSHLEKSVQALRQCPEAGLCSSNANLINEEGKHIDTFFPVNQKGHVMGQVPEGEVYERVVMRYCVCTPTIVFDSVKLKQIGGYNEALVYEDFDIMTRLARKYPFAFSDHIGVNKRIHGKAFSRQQYKTKSSSMLDSTVKVCKNIAIMNRTGFERKALIYRCVHEAKHALASANFGPADELLHLAESLGANGLAVKLLRLWHGMKLDVSFLYERLKKL